MSLTSFTNSISCGIIFLFFVIVLVIAQADMGAAQVHGDNNITTSENPNVVVIMTDDQGFETLGVYGGESYETPVLDKLAKTGIRFTEAHATPVCTPTRLEIMSGRYNSRNYIEFGKMSPDVYTFGNLFQDNDYATFIGGKWQLSGGLDAPYQFGFDEYALWQVTRRPNRYANPGLEINGEEKNYTNGEYGPDIINNHVLDFIERHQEKPFLVYYPMVLTHWPFDPTPDSPEWDPTYRKEDMAEQAHADDRDQKYFGDMVTYADKLVGKVVQKLEQLGLRENTLIIFTGDNGTAREITSMVNGKAFEGGKLSSTEAGTHVPLIANWPGVIPKGTVNEDLIRMPDFFPTLAEVAGIDIPKNIALDGESFAPILYGQEANLSDWAYMWWYRNNDPEGAGGEFAWTHRYKYYQDGRFYDLREDSLEKDPPIPADQFTEKQQKVRNRLQSIIIKYTRDGFYEH